MSQFSDPSPLSDEATRLPMNEGEMLTLSAEDIEAAYERALQAVTTAEKSIGFDDVDPIEEVTPADVVPAPTSVEDESTPVESSAGDNQADQDIIADVTEAGGGRIQPRQVLEAALFVGGDSLTTKRLGMMLGEGISAEEVEELIASLNAQYADEHRPYEIRLSEGGYRLVLLEEFEAVQSRVYGTNPKDVKLSQEALEVLAFVAYRQPVTSDDLEETEKPNAMSLLRQLMRRQLVKLERDESNASAVTYHTTPRFLELFGLRSLNDLPFPEDLVLK